MNNLNNLKQKKEGKEEIADKGKGDTQNEGNIAFRRSSLLLRSPPARITPNQNVSGSGSAHAAPRGVMADSPTKRSAHANTRALKKDASSTNARESQGAQQTPTSTHEAGKQLVTPTPINGSMAFGETPAANESAPTGATETSPRLDLIKKMRKMEEDAISQCRLIISTMQQAFRRQKNISNDVKVGVYKMDELIDVVLNYRRSWKAAEGDRTISSLRKNTATQPNADIPTPTTANLKRVATSPAASEGCKKPRAREPRENKKGLSENKDEGWQTVIKKNSQKKPKSKPIEANKKKPRTQHVKPEAVVIKPAEGHSYADVLKDLRDKITADESVKVRSVRKTKAGAILLEFGRGEKVTPEFVHQLKSTVQDTATIAELKPSATIEIRDLDSLTVKAEVEAAIRKLLTNKDEQIQTRITAPNAREQVRAFLTLSAEGAAKLVEIGEIKIGWIRTKMRACEQIKRCYRCLGVGHTQANCAGPDRRDMCIRCGSLGHKIKDCKAAPNCIHCVDAKRHHTDHLPGSRRCPLAKK